MRLLFILISVAVLALMITFSLERLFVSPPVPPGAGINQLDTSLPAVNRQVDNLQNTAKNYQDTLQKQQDLINQGK